VHQDYVKMQFGKDTAGEAGVGPKCL